MWASERHSARWVPTTGTNCASASNPLEIAEDWPAGGAGGDTGRASFSPPAKELAPRPSYFDLILAAAEHIYPTSPRARAFPIRCYTTALSSGLIESAS